VAVRFHRHRQHKFGNQDYRQDPFLSLPVNKERGRVSLPDVQPKTKQNLSQKSNKKLARSFTDKMTPKPNLITAWNEGVMGDKEFIVSCKGRPFSILTAPQFPTPNVTYVDYSLVHELNLRLSDMQCRKLSFCGQKLRILGQISTTVQCIANGATAGNLQFKAHVVEDLKKHFDTHSIAGVKLSNKLLGSSAQISNENSTEPTDVSSSESPVSDVESKKKKKRKKLLKTTMATRSSDETQSTSEEESDDEMTYGEKLVAMLNAQSAIPIEERTINPRHQAIIDSLGLNSNQPQISSSNLAPDEYNDTYTNVSTVLTGSAAKPGLPKTESTKYKKHPKKQAAQVQHGADKCTMMCEACDDVSTIPEDCGYNPRIVPEDFEPCSLQCPGRWCPCFKRWREWASLPEGGGRRKR